MQNAELLNQALNNRLSWEPLSQGGQGTVFKYKANNTNYCVKRLESVNAYNNEIQTATALNRFTEGKWFSNEKVGYIMLPYYGITLSELITNQYISSNYLLMLMIKMVDELQRMHDAKYLHNDVKQDNFIVDRTDVHIIDFGLSRQVGARGFHGQQYDNAPERNINNFKIDEDDDEVSEESGYSNINTIECETYVLGRLFQDMFLRSIVLAIPLIYFGAIRNMMSTKPGDRSSLKEVRQNLMSVFHWFSGMLAVAVGLSVGLFLEFYPTKEYSLEDIPWIGKYPDYTNAGVSVVVAAVTFSVSYLVQKPYRASLMSTENSRCSEGERAKKGPE